MALVACTFMGTVWMCFVGFRNGSIAERSLFPGPASLGAEPVLGLGGAWIGILQWRTNALHA
jgi:hypothetical protein